MEKTSGKLNKRLINKIIISLIIISVLIYLFQITVAKNLSLSSDQVDHLFHFTQNTILLLVFILILALIFYNSKETWQKITLGIIGIPILLIFFVATLFSLGVIFTPKSANIRHYFYEKDGYNYYVISERFWAFEGSSNLKYYKEKPLFLFIKHRPEVSEHEISINGINLRDVNEQFFKKYFHE
jgi:hypothetical protein